METESSTRYRVFWRCARSWEEFSGARKHTVERGLTYDQAQRRCDSENAQLTTREIARGKRYEFTSD